MLAEFWRHRWLLYGVILLSLVAVSMVANVLAEGVVPARLLPKTPEQFDADARARGIDGPITYDYIPAPGNVGEPTLYGPYRIVPWGYANAMPKTDVSVPSGVIVNPPQSASHGGFPSPEALAEAIAVLETSSLWALPTYVPPGYSLVSASTGQGHSEFYIRLTYRFPGRPPLQVERIRNHQKPIDVYQYREGDARVLSTGTIKGQPAIFTAPTPEYERFPKHEAQYVDDQGIETAVRAIDVPLDEVIRIAESFPYS